MIKSLYRILSFFLTLQIAVLPSFAQTMPAIGGGSSFNERLGQFQRGSSRSFRLNDQDSRQQGNSYESDSDVFTRALGASEGTLAGVTYQVHIVGEVNHPGTYRVTASDRLQEALQRAGGITDRGSKRRIEIARQNSGRRFYDLYKFQTVGDLKNNPFLLDNDTVFIPLKRNVVRVVGAVQRPKEYELLNEKTLDQVLTLAGGRTSASLHREPIRIVRFDGGDKQLLSYAQDTAEMHQANVKGGDVIYIPSVLNADRKIDFALEEIPGTDTFYPASDDQVYVLGGVSQPGPFAFTPYRSMQQYLTLAGGVNKLAKVKKIKIIRTNGAIELTKGVSSHIRLNPGDTIYVPEQRIPPESKVTLALGVVSSLLGLTTTIIALPRLLN